MSCVFYVYIFRLVPNCDSMVTILEHRIENTHIRKNCLDELELNREPVHVVGFGVSGNV